MNPSMPVNDAPLPTTRLVVMDVDSTLIDQEVIEVLAGEAGTAAEVAEITERAMNGEIDFTESLRERVATLAGLKTDIFDTAIRSVTLTRGVAQFVSDSQARGWHVALVSGGFAEVVVPLAQPLGITRIRANRLEIVDGVLTGRTTGPVIDAAAKAAALRDFAAELDLELSDTIAIGDGANDLEMLGLAGIGIAFCAKPFVQARTTHHVTERDFAAVLPLIDSIDNVQSA